MLLTKHLDRLTGTGKVGWIGKPQRELLTDRLATVRGRVESALRWVVGQDLVLVAIEGGKCRQR